MRKGDEAGLDAVMNVSGRNQGLGKAACSAVTGIDGKLGGFLRAEWGWLGSVEQFNL
jgi:hypothetical protein